MHFSYFVLFAGYSGAILSYILLFHIAFKKYSQRADIATIHLTAIIMSVTMLALGWAGIHRAEKMAESSLRKQSQRLATALKIAGDGKLLTINKDVRLMAGDSWVKPALNNPNQENITRARRNLQRYKDALNASECYLIDTDGVTIAATNFNTDYSFEGNNYSFRPYFTGAKKGIPSNYFALGITSGKRGYYASAPVFCDDSNRVCGVAVIKKGIDSLEKVFQRFPFAFLTDSNGVIFAASDSTALFRILEPVTQDREILKNHARQFGNVTFKPILSDTITDGFAHMEKESFIVSQEPIGLSGWLITVLEPLTRVYRVRYMGVSIILALIVTVLIIMGFFTWNRHRAWLSSIAKSEDRFKSIFAHAPEAIFIVDRELGLIRGANPLACSLVGKKEEDLLATPVSEVLYKADSTEPIDAALPIHESKWEGVKLVQKEGAPIDVAVSSTTIVFQKKQALLLFLRDITGLIAAQKELAKSEAKYRNLTEHMQETIFETDIQGRITFANKSAFQRFGYTQEQFDKGIPALVMVAPQSRERAQKTIEEILKGQQTEYNEYMAIRSDGTEFPVMVHSDRIVDEQGRPIGIRGMMIDISERKQLEKESQRADKLEALGFLAGGLAHDFNNLLSGIWTGLSFLKLRLPSDTTIQETIVNLESAVKRGKNITTQLLTFSKGGDPILDAVSLEDLVRETAQFALSGSKSKLEIIAEADLGAAHIDKGQISQVVQNIILNASQSMPSGGVIRVSLSCISHKEFKKATPGSYVKMVISDEGRGIAEEDLEHIFDPFFTRKTGGNGLGLAMVYSIIKKHNGYITVSSELHKGTTFTILLPASQNKLVSHRPKPAVHTGKGHILIMDDESIIRKTSAILLKQLGYSVVAVESGQDAVSAYSDALHSDKPFDLAIFDLTIPGGMGGFEALTELKKIDPHICAIVSSGYSDDRVMADYQTYGFAGVIKKPYGVEEMCAVLNQVLGV